jgi:hypothetical protein
VNPSAPAARGLGEWMAEAAGIEPGAEPPKSSEAKDSAE